MTEADCAKITGHPVLLYDGVCALCNGVVRFVLKHDKAKVFRFAALESNAGKELLGGDVTTHDGVALIVNALTPGQQAYRRSDAVAETMRLLGWPGLGRALLILPRSLREAGYSVVARLRYKVFGRYEVCPLPNPDQGVRFLR